MTDPLQPQPISFGDSDPSVVPATESTTAPLDASARALRHLVGLQHPGGDWEGEMVWCTMILVQAVIVRTVVGQPYGEAEKAGIVKHFEYYQRADGSFGMHPESTGYVFFTALAYIALRLLDLQPETPILARAKSWLHAQPKGVKGIPTWGKFWLAMLGLYEYSGLNGIPPELFLMPEWLPFHPRRFYCHTRQIYLGLAFLYGKRFQAPLPAAFRNSLRQELYGEPYESIDFPTLRNEVATSDVHVPISAMLRGVYRLLGIHERFHNRTLREKALTHCFDRIVYEQRASRYQGISPVSGLLNCLALFAQDPHHPDLAPSLQGVEAWRWTDEEEGIRYVGARSNTWDTAFAMQALAEAPVVVEGLAQALEKGQGFLAQAQMLEELPDREAGWRDIVLGGWCFSDGEHRWPVSDCAAEALAALLTLADSPGSIAAMEPQRLKIAVDFILSRQNADGGFGTYERRRGGRLLEMINPSEMFGQCMTELSYIECTASAIAALAHYRQHFPDFAPGSIDIAIARAVALLRSNQREDGSYLGFWGINVTYALFHVAKGLRAAGVPASDPTLQRAGRWLLDHQRADGGWGEDYHGCLEGRYVEHAESQAVMTAWALLALLDILPPQTPEIGRGIQWLRDHQQADGGWPRQAVNGVFFGAAMLDYRLYHQYFPAWAVTRYTRLITGFNEAAG